MWVESRNANRGRTTVRAMARSRVRARFSTRPKAGSSTVRCAFAAGADGPISFWPSRVSAPGVVGLLQAIALALLGLVIFLAHLPLIRDPIEVRPDGAEYLGIARHFAWEGRWVSDIKWHFTTNEPVRHSALGDRPPLYPLAAAGAVRLSQDFAAQVYAARLLNACLAALAACLAWCL